MEMSVKVVKILFRWPGSKRLLGGHRRRSEDIIEADLRHSGCVYVEKCKHENTMLCERGVAGGRGTAAPGGRVRGAGTAKWLF
jgi:hypothetical protein